VKQIVVYLGYHIIIKSVAQFINNSKNGDFNENILEILELIIS